MANADIPITGVILVVSSPSGAGKTAMTRGLLKIDDNIRLSVSATTRSPRPGERDGDDYQFVPHGTFEQRRDQGDFLEYAEVFDHWYGTPKQAVVDHLHAGRDVLFDIDWQGARQLRQALGDSMVSVFVLPPSKDELAKRLHRRAQDDEAVVRRRLAQAVSDMRQRANYDYVIVNTDLEDSIEKLQAVLVAERQRRYRLEPLCQSLDLGDF